MNHIVFKEEDAEGSLIDFKEVLENMDCSDGNDHL